MSNYQSMVAEARRLSAKSEEAQWRLAEITHEALSSGTTAQQWATDIGLSVGRVSNYLKVWDRYSDPASRNASWTFNDHSEVSRLADEKAKAIIAKAERENISIGIARKRVSQEESHRAKFEAERQADLDAALADTGNVLAGHQEAVESTRKDVLARRAFDGARQAAQPFLQSALATKVMLIPSKASDLLEAIEQANTHDIDIADLNEVMTSLRKAVEAVEFHAAKRGLTVEVAK